MNKEDKELVETWKRLSECGLICGFVDCTDLPVENCKWGCHCHYCVVHIEEHFHPLMGDDIKRYLSKQHGVRARIKALDENQKSQSAKDEMPYNIYDKPVVKDKNDDAQYYDPDACWT